MHTRERRATSFRLIEHNATEVHVALQELLDKQMAIGYRLIPCEFCAIISHIIGSSSLSVIKAAN
jgi:hypothetical protein